MTVTKQIQGLSGKTFPLLILLLAVRQTSNIIFKSVEEAAARSIESYPQQRYRSPTEEKREALSLLFISCQKVTQTSHNQRQAIKQALEGLCAQGLIEFDQGQAKFRLKTRATGVGGKQRDRENQPRYHDANTCGGIQATDVIG